MCSVSLDYKSEKGFQYCVQLRLNFFILSMLIFILILQMSDQLHLHEDLVAYEIFIVGPMVCPEISQWFHIIWYWIIITVESGLACLMSTPCGGLT